MYVIARQLWGRTFPEQAAAARRRGRPPGHDPPRAGRAQPASTARPRTWSTTPGRRSTGSRSSSASNDILRLPEPDRCQVIEMPEFQRGNSVAYLNPAPPLDPKAASVYAVSPPPRDWDARRVESFLRRVQPVHAADPDHPRGLPGPLRPAGILQPPPVADPPGAVLRRLRRGLGGLHRADDARPGLRRRRPGAAAATS